MTAEPTHGIRHFQQRVGQPIESIGEIAVSIAPADPHDNLVDVLARFQSDKQLRVLPVVEEGRLVGILNRSTFLEEHVIGMHGFAFHINHSKKMRDLMNPVVMSLEAETPIREAALLIQARDTSIQLDNVCVTRDGYYAGVVDLNSFISAITEINLMLAKGANPLTGLPGNECIQREITARLACSHSFDIIYIDIDNFKPYNDYYGFQKGDVVIKTLGEIVAALAVADDSIFCAHIGGDDFIVICTSSAGEGIANAIVDEFHHHLALFHGPLDFAAGSYTTPNRKGDPETFHLLSLSMGIVSTAITSVESYAQLASISSEVKKAAKMIQGFSVVIDRRRGIWEQTENNETILPQEQIAA